MDHEIIPCSKTRSRTVRDIHGTREYGRHDDRLNVPEIVGINGVDDGHDCVLSILAYPCHHGLQPSFVCFNV